MRPDKPPYEWLPDVMLFAQQAYEAIYDRGIPNSLDLSFASYRETSPVYVTGSSRPIDHFVSNTSINIVDNRTGASHSATLPSYMDTEQADYLFLIFRIFVVRHVESVFPELLDTLPYRQLIQSISLKEKGFVQFFLPFTIADYWNMTSVYKRHVRSPRQSLITPMGPRHNL